MARRLNGMLFEILSTPWPITDTKTWMSCLWADSVGVPCACCLRGFCSWSLRCAHFARVQIISFCRWHLFGIYFSLARSFIFIVNLLWSGRAPSESGTTRCKLCHEYTLSTVNMEWIEVGRKPSWNSNSLVHCGGGDGGIRQAPFSSNSTINTALDRVVYDHRHLENNIIRKYYVTQSVVDTRIKDNDRILEFKKCHKSARHSCSHFNYSMAFSPASHCHCVRHV